MQRKEAYALTLNGKRVRRDDGKLVRVRYMTADQAQTDNDGYRQKEAATKQTQPRYNESRFAAKGQIGL